MYKVIRKSKVLVSGDLMGLIDFEIFNIMCLQKP